MTTGLRDMACDVELFPGDFCFASQGMRIGTLLGSCVAITMWHPRLLVGGMCHYVLPCRKRGHGEPDGRYADEAMQLFLEEIARYAAGRAEYQVRMFGGGEQFSATTTGTTTVPERNVAAGLELLAQNGFVLFDPDLGGRGPRRVTLDVATGEVTMRHPDLATVGL